jgi:hypothetical protein
MFSSYGTRASNPAGWTHCFDGDRKAGDEGWKGLKEGRKKFSV